MALFLFNFSDGDEDQAASVEDPSMPTLQGIA
jgi:hypothetical protein